MSLTEKLFKVKERGSSTKTEFLGAVLSLSRSLLFFLFCGPGMLADARNAYRRRNGGNHLGSPFSAP